MPKLNRVHQSIFGLAAPTIQFSEFGSFAAGLNVPTKDPAVIQAGNYFNGWFAAILGSNSPCIEDMNALFFLITYQLSKIFEVGIPEYTTDTNYFIGSFVTSNSKVYISLIDDNINQSLSDQTKWYLQGALVSVKTVANTLAAGPSIVELDATAASFIQTLPPLAGYEIGEKISFKCVNTNANTVTLKGNGSETIDGSNTYPTALQTMESVTLYKSSSTKWFTIN